MHDTNDVIKKKMLELMFKKSPVERLRIGCSMFMFAKTLAKASIEQDGGLPENILRQQLFLRFYGEDFGDVQKNKILNHLNKLKISQGVEP